MDLLLLGVAEACCLLYIHYLSLSFPPDAFAFLAAFLAAFWFYLLAAFRVLARPSVGQPMLATILLLAAAFRLTLWLDPLPLFDNDIHRYLWDGKVLIHGINPYRYAPDAPQLSNLRDANFYRVGFPYIPTIYPPLSQLFFAASALLAPGSFATMKVVFILADLSTIGLLLLTLQRLGLPLSLVLVYAWHPLPVKEFADSGHLDALAMAFTWLALLLALPPQRSRAANLGASLALAGAGLVKLYPLLLAPFLFRRIGWRYAAPSAALIGAVYLPFLWSLPLTQAFAGLQTYGRYWEFNSSIFALLQYVFASGTAARVLAGAALLAGGIYLYCTGEDTPLALLHRCASLLALLFLVSPTVDPWYICAITPFLCVLPSRSWLYLTGASALSYGFYISRDLDHWFRLCEYVPFYSLLAWEYWRHGPSLVVPWLPYPIASPVDRSGSSHTAGTGP